MKEWSCARHPRYITHTTSITIADPYTDDDIFRISYCPVISEVRAGSGFYCHGERCSEDTRYPKSPRPIFLVTEYLEEHIVLIFSEIEYISIGMDDFFEGNLRKPQRYTISVVASIMVEDDPVRPECFIYFPYTNPLSKPHCGAIETISECFFEPNGSVRLRDIVFWDIVLFFLLSFIDFCIVEDVGFTIVSII